MVSMMDILSGAAPLMGDVRQSGSGPAHPVVAVAPPISARVTACCYLNTTVLGLCHVKAHSSGFAHRAKVL
jgi:hypothetical protein